MWVQIVLFLCLIVGAAVLLSGDRNYGPSTMPPVRMVDSGCDLAIPFQVDRKGLPLVKVRIGSPPQWVSVVIDTGSSDLVVAGAQCASCRSKFNPEKSQTGVRLDACQAITYGTQRDEGCWYMDNVEFEGVCVSECLSSSTHRPRTSTLRRTMTFVVTHRRTPSPYGGGHPASNYCILGLAQTPRNDSNVAAIRQMIPPESAAKFTIVHSSKKNNRFLVLGEMPPCQGMVWAPLPPVHHEGFFAARVSQVHWGGAVRGIDAMVLDSGSNKVFIPHTAWTAEMDRTARAGQDLVIRFSETAALTVPGHKVRGVVMPYDSNDGVMVLGCLVVENTAIEFDITSHHVRVAHLR